MNSIIWKGVSSTSIQGLLICELPPITKPEMRTKETIIDGRDGSIIEELGYASYVKTITIGLHGNFDIDKIIKYFTGEGDIIFSNEPDKVYKAKICGRIDYTRLLRYRQASIPFMVQPFKYKLNEYLRETPTATASGTSIVVNDSIDASLKAFKIYGKSTQNGTPTPDAPVDIVSVGDDGSIVTTINGTNLFNLKSGVINGTNKPVTYIDNGFVLNAESNETRIYRFKCNLKKGISYFLSFDATKISGTGEVSPYLPKLNQYIPTGRPFVPNEDTDELGLYIGDAYVPTVANVTNIQVSMSNGKKEYEPFKSQSVTIPLTNGLNAIPVTDKSLATYTDANGQMWCADEIDLERGVYVQRIGKYVCTGSEDWYIPTFATHPFFMTTKMLALPTANIWKLGCAICSHFNISHPGYEETNCANVNGNGYLCIQYNEIATLVEFMAYLTAQYNNGSPVTITYILGTPIETPLTDEQIAICKALKSNNPTTTILNDENAPMMVEYFKPFEVFNEGLENSKPLMVLKGSGTVEITVNGVGIFTYTFPEGENEVYIDSETEDAYWGDVLKNRNMNGEFPVLIPKTNKIEWSGDIESISILPRSRWL